ncbi:MAG: dissimilatory-type sulfite reductase subunit beta, partial [Gammaproteobacteria bacterium]
MSQTQMRTPIESGCPDGMQYMHPVMVKNFGMWKYHEHPRPGVLRHVSESGDEIWTVKCGTQRILDLYTLRK